MMGRGVIPGLRAGLLPTALAGFERTRRWASGLVVPDPSHAGVVGTDSSSAF